MDYKAFLKALLDFETTGKTSFPVPVVIGTQTVLFTLGLSKDDKGQTHAALMFTGTITIPVF